MRHLVCLPLIAVLLATPVATSFAQSGSKPAEAGSAAKPAAEAGSAAKHIAASPEAIKPLKVGDAAPAATVKNSAGAEVALADMAAAKPTIVVFYRGGWCPYCNTHLADLAKVQPEIAAAGAQLVAISPDSPETLKAYEAEHALPYTLLSDSSHAATKAYGVAYAVDTPTQEKLKGYGIDLVKASGNSQQVMPVPSVFVIKDGKIAYAHGNVDYTKRLSGAEVVAALGMTKAEAGSATKSAEGGSGTKQ